MSEIGVVYLTRGLDPNWQTRLSRFIASYQLHPAGIDHQLYILYKHFATPEDLGWAREQLMCLRPYEILAEIDVPSFSPSPASKYVHEPILCTFNSTTEIMHDDWLKKLHDVFSRPDVGLVGCSGSSDNSTLHVRDTAILVDCLRYMMIADQFDFTTKKGWLEFENGPNNLTQQILRAGLKVFVVEKDRVRAPEEWPITTYRGNLENVLVHDRGARDWRDL